MHLNTFYNACSNTYPEGECDSNFGNDNRSCECNGTKTDKTKMAVRSLGKGGAWEEEMMITWSQYDWFQHMVNEKRGEFPNTWMYIGNEKG